MIIKIVSGGGIEIDGRLLRGGIEDIVKFNQEGKEPSGWSEELESKYTDTDTDE